jgi:phosphate uptake regulator
MSTSQAAVRYVDALQELVEAVLAEIRAEGEEGARFSQRLLDEAQVAQQRALTLLRRLAEQPMDVAGNVAAWVEATAQAQAQAIDLTRAWFEGLLRGGEERRARLAKIAAATRRLYGLPVTPAGA